MEESAVDMEDMGNIYILSCGFSGAFNLWSWRLNFASTKAYGKWVI